jgi:hypothetical protein
LASAYHAQHGGETPQKRFAITVNDWRHSPGLPHEDENAAGEDIPLVSLFGHSPTNDAHVTGPRRALFRAEALETRFTDTKAQQLEVTTVVEHIRNLEKVTLRFTAMVVAVIFIA